MKKLLSFILASLMILSLIGCGSESKGPASEPSKSQMQSDVSDYVTNVVVPGSKVTYFTVEDGNLEGESYVATCIATYETDTTRYLDQFTLTYEANGDEWEMEKIALNESYAQRSETPLEGTEEVADGGEAEVKDDAKDDAKDTPATSEEVTMSDDIKDFTFTLDNVVYKLPTPYQTFVDNGWTISSSGVFENTKISANSYDSVQMAKAGNKITVYIINLSGNEKEISQCKVGGIEVQVSNISDPSFFTIAKGVTVANSASEVQDALGSANDYNEKEDYTTLKYTPTDNYNVSLSFYIYSEGSDMEKYSSITMKNYVADESDITETSEEVPEYLSTYVDPKIDTASGLKAEAYFTLDGKTYNLPCPVSLLLDEGWTMSSKPNAIGAGNYDGVTLQKGQDKFSVTLTNYASYQTIPENCAITKVSVDEYYMKGSAVIDFFGIKIGTKKDAVAELVSGTSDKWDMNESTSSITYSYYSSYKADKEVNVYIRIDSSTGKVSDIDITGKTWAY